MEFRLLKTKYLNAMIQEEGGLTCLLIFLCEKGAKQQQQNATKFAKFAKIDKTSRD
jgi:hypothetical protein